MKDVSDQPLPQLKPRENDGHKGSYGRVLLVGGSRGMAGAVALSGMAALRSGAGLVTVATPRCIQATVAGFCPAYMTVGLADDDQHVDASAIDVVLQIASAADVVALGPGLGKSAAVERLVKRCYRELTQVAVVDADGLNALAPLDLSSEAVAGPRILTPHPGEFARLTGDWIPDIAMPSGDAGRYLMAVEFAKRDPRCDTTVVLKGAGTVVASSDRYAINPTGNPGMATGGTGDVLTGVIAALSAQGLPAWDAARLGVYVHGLAGDLAAEQQGQVSLVATDVIDFLPAAFRQL